MPTRPDPPSALLKLVTLNGPTQVVLSLRPPGPLMIGRRAEYAIELRDPTVSREHAILSFEPDLPDQPTGPGRWYVADTGSRHGTWHNGEQLVSGRPQELRADDYLAIGPWTFRLVAEESEPTPEDRFSVATLDDGHMEHSIVSRLDAREAENLERQKLALLLECAEAIHAAESESALAEAVLDAAVAGTMFTNAAVLKPMREDEQVEVLAHRGRILEPSGSTGLSRSLIREAAQGVPATLSAAEDQSVPAHSIMELGIEQALCVPIMLGNAVAGFLYLDVRSQSRESRQRLAAEAGGFAMGLARLAAMALSNLMRLDIQKRHAQISAELKAAAETQQYLLPPRAGEFGVYRYLGESRPGRQMGGDFFDVFPLDDERLVVTLGDVTGKGVVASVLMTASLGFLHAALAEHGDPGRAISELNRYIEPRCAYNRFLTLWIGVLDRKKGLLRYVDGGHGYGFLVKPDGALVTLDEHKGALVGGLPDVEYTTAEIGLEAGARVLVVSDGIIEQPPVGLEESAVEQFGIERLEDCLRGTPREEDTIAAIFDAVIDYAGTSQLADDATAVIIDG